MDAQLGTRFCGISATTFKAAVRAKDAPEPVRITKGRLGWRRPDLQHWVDRKLESGSSSGSDPIGDEDFVPVHQSV